MDEAARERGKAALEALGEKHKLLGAGESLSVEGQVVSVYNSSLSVRRVFDFATETLFIRTSSSDGGAVPISFAQLTPAARALADVLRPLVAAPPVAPLVALELDRQAAEAAAQSALPARLPLGPRPRVAAPGR